MTEFHFIVGHYLVLTAITVVLVSCLFPAFRHPSSLLIVVLLVALLCCNSIGLVEHLKARDLCAWHARNIFRDPLNQPQRWLKVQNGTKFCPFCGQLHNKYWVSRNGWESQVNAIMEHVLVIPRSELERLGTFQGFNPNSDHYINGFQIMEFKPREDMEKDPSFKQLIPYVIIVSDGKVFQYTRNGSEKRLDAKKSIGVGGHINDIDAQDPITNCAHREIMEEVTIGDYDLEIIGLINDDRTAVGSVHLGVVMVATATGDVLPREKALQDAGLVEVDMLDFEALEDWSKLCLPFIEV